MVGRCGSVRLVPRVSARAYPACLLRSHAPLSSGTKGAGWIPAFAGMTKPHGGGFGIGGYVWSGIAASFGDVGLSTVLDRSLPASPVRGPSGRRSPPPGIG